MSVSTAVGNLLAVTHLSGYERRSFLQLQCQLSRTFVQSHDAICLQACNTGHTDRGVYPKGGGVGRAICHIFKVGGG